MIDLNGSAAPGPDTRLAEAALEYASSGRFSVIPCRPGEKEPLTSHGFKDASNDETQVTQWWRQSPNANIGIPTGNGMLALDVDGPEGEQSLAALLAVHGPLPETPEQTTGKGRHLLFSVEGKTKNTSRRLGAGLDTRGDGGYIIVAPSIHPNGKRYEWVSGRSPSEVEVAPAPEWLIAKLVKPKINERTSTGAQRPDPSEIPEAYVRRAVEDEYQKVATAPTGTRNTIINEAAFALGQLVGAGVLDEFTARCTLEAAADACGALGDEREKTFGTIARGLAAGILQPRDLSEVGASRKTAGGRDTPEKDEHAGEVRGSGAARRERQPNAPEGRALLGEWLKDIVYRAEPELVEGVLPWTGLGFLYGPSSAGKSFIAIDWGLSLASGMQVLGRPTQPSGVLYIAAEGQTGLRKRLVAARRQRNLDDVELPFNYLPAFINLADPDGAEVERVLDFARKRSDEMQSLGAPLRLIIIDTMAAAAPGVDENTGKDMGPLILRLQILAADLNCLVLVVAHVGKDEARGLRGWSGSRAAADVAIECRVEREDEKFRESPVKRRYIWFEKAKDGPCGFTLADYDLRSVELGKKQSGLPDTTCWVEYAVPAAPQARSSVADTIEAQARAQARKEAFDEKMLTAIVDLLTDNWTASTTTAARLQEQAGITLGREKLLSKLRVLGSDVPDDIVTIERPGARIEIRTTKPTEKSNVAIHFRVIRETSAAPGDACEGDDCAEAGAGGGLAEAAQGGDLE